MKSIRIRGGGPTEISGSIRPGGNKNAALPFVAAALLTDEELVLHNMPEILDVDRMIGLAEHLGASAERTGKTVRICAKNLTRNELPEEMCAALRASFVFAGAIAARCGEAVLGLPGGDMIGRRRLDSHYYGLGKLGISPEFSERHVSFRVGKKGLTGAEMFLDEASVTATEHILLAAVLAKGTTVIRNAAAEPHVQQLCELLNDMGAKITGIETNTLTVEGVEKLHGAEFTVDADHIEIAGFLAMAAATRGSIEFTGKIQPRHYWMTRRVFERFGIRFSLEPDRIQMKGGQKMRIVPDVGGVTPMISDGPWPAFPTDMMSCMIVAATQASGTVLFFEKMFESRIYFVDRLIAMGANAIVCDPHRVVISGPTKLHATEMSSPDIRAGMAMILAAVCAQGESVIHNADIIFRGYESIIDKLKALGIDVDLIER